METHKDLPVYLFATSQEWLDWLERHHNNVPAIWIKLAKKNSGVHAIGYDQAREGALIYGWIDGLANSYDEKFYLQRFTPRRPKGQWSAINRDIVEGLIRTGKMKPSGLAQVQAAKADGRWKS